MKAILAILFALLIAPGIAAANNPSKWGIVCNTNCWTEFPNLATQLGVYYQRVAMNVAVPFTITHGGVKSVYVVNGNLNIGDGPSNQIKFFNLDLASGVSVADSICSPAFGEGAAGCTTIKAVLAQGVKTNAAVIHYVSDNSATMVVIQNYQGLGQQFELHLNNQIAAVTPVNGPLSGTLEGDANWNAEMALTMAQIKATGFGPDWLTSGNEENLPGGSDTSTPTQYLHLLSLVCAYAHSIGTRCNDSGNNITSANLIYWCHLFYAQGSTCLGTTLGSTLNTSDNMAAADAFANAAFGRGAGGGLQSDMPSSCNPTFPMLGSIGNVGQLASMQAAAQIHAGLVAAGVDGVSFHWFQTPPPAEDGNFRWIMAETGKPVVLDAIGLYSESAVDTVRMLREAAAIGSPMILWFARHGVKAAGLISDAGVLQHNSGPFIDFVAGYGAIPRGNTYIKAGCASAG